MKSRIWPDRGERNKSGADCSGAIEERGPNLKSTYCDRILQSRKNNTFNFAAVRIISAMVIRARYSGVSIGLLANGWKGICGDEANGAVVRPRMSLSMPT